MQKKGEKNKMLQKVNWRGFIAPIIAGSLLWVLTPFRPISISATAWHLFSIFLGTIIACITQPLPMMSITIISITIAALTGIFNIKEITSAFGNDICWMIALCLFMSAGFINSGLGKRIAYYFIKLFGKSTLRLAYALSAVEVILSIGIPSNNARLNGIIYPIIDNLSRELGSNPQKNTQDKLGSYLVFNEYEVDIIASALFLTGLGGNMVAISLAKGQGISISWLQWFLAALVPGLLSLILTPLLLYKICSPKIKETPNSKKWANQELSKMGKMSISEKIMASVFILATILWLIGPKIGISATLVAFIAVSILLMTGVISVKDMVNTKFAWNLLVWLSLIILMSEKLTKMKFFNWFSESLGTFLHGINPILVLMILCIIYFYLHYLFPSIITQISALYTGFLSVAISAGAPPLLSALLLAYYGVIDLSSSPYSQGTAAFLSGTGYVSPKDWWRLSAIVGVLLNILWLGGGLIWTKIIGIW